MKKHLNNLKPLIWLLFSLKKKPFLSIVLGLVYLSPASSQIYVKENASIVVNEGTQIFIIDSTLETAHIISDSLNSKKEKSKIYIIKGTSIKGKLNADIVYLNPSVKKTKPNNLLSKKKEAETKLEVTQVQKSNYIDIKEFFHPFPKGKSSVMTSHSHLNLIIRNLNNTDHAKKIEVSKDLYLFSWHLESKKKSIIYKYFLKTTNSYNPFNVLRGPPYFS